MRPAQEHARNKGHTEGKEWARKNGTSFDLKELKNCKSYADKKNFMFQFDEYQERIKKNDPLLEVWIESYIKGAIEQLEAEMGDRRR